MLSRNDKNQKINLEYLRFDTCMALQIEEDKNILFLNSKITSYLIYIVNYGIFNKSEF